MLQRVLQLISLLCRSTEFKELEIVVLRHELAVLRRQVRRPALRLADRLFLATASRLPPRVTWPSFLLTPTTLLDWHRRLVANRWTSARRPGRPPVGGGVRALIVRLAHENPRWDYQRHAGRLEGIGIVVSATTVSKVLREEALGPAGNRTGPSWRESLRAPAQSVIAVEFFAVDTVWLQRVYVLFFIAVASCRVHLAGCTAHPMPNGSRTRWLGRSPNGKEPVCMLIRDRDRKFTGGFDAVFEAQGIRIVRTPIQSTEANGVAERFVLSIRSECLDWIMILDRDHLERVVRVFIDHYNGHRPHRPLGLISPEPPRPTIPTWCGGHIQRRDRLGGVIHDYAIAA